jgi:hypothetical protein
MHRSGHDVLLTVRHGGTDHSLFATVSEKHIFSRISLVKQQCIMLKYENRKVYQGWIINFYQCIMLDCAVCNWQPVLVGKLDGLQPPPPTTSSSFHLLPPISHLLPSRLYLSHSKSILFIGIVSWHSDFWLQRSKDTATFFFILSVL